MLAASNREQLPNRACSQTEVTAFARAVSFLRIHPVSLLGPHASFACGSRLIIVIFFVRFDSTSKAIAYKRAVFSFRALASCKDQMHIWAIENRIKITRSCSTAVAGEIIRVLGEGALGLALF